MTSPITLDPNAPPIPSSSTVSGTTPEPWRVPLSDPREWARGKTAEELLAVTDQAISHLRNTISQPPAYQPPAYQPPAPARFEMPGDEDVVTGAQLKQIAGLMVGAMGQDAGQIQQMAQLALSHVRGEFPKEFGKYEPEILGELQRLPRKDWSLDNLRMMVKLVRSNHIDDLANERADQRLAQMGIPARSNGSATGGPAGNDLLSLESESLPADYRERLTKAGVTMETAREFCRSNNLTLAQWFEMAKKTRGVIGEG